MTSKVAPNDVHVVFPPGPDYPRQAQELDADELVCLSCRGDAMSETLTAEGYEQTKENCAILRRAWRKSRNGRTSSQGGWRVFDGPTR